MARLSGGQTKFSKEVIDISLFMPFPFGRAGGEKVRRRQGYDTTMDLELVRRHKPQGKVGCNIIGSDKCFDIDGDILRLTP